MRHLKPREVQGCALALDAMITASMFDATSGGSPVTNGTGVARWEDQSGNARHVTQATSGARPIFRATGLNSLPSCEFDGGDILSRASVAIQSLYAANLTDTEVLLVMSDTSAGAAAFTLHAESITTNRINLHATWSDGNIYWDARDNSGARVSAAQPSGWLNAAHVLSAGRQGANMQLVVDRSQIASRANASGSITAATVTLGVGGQPPSGSHVGHIAEVAIWALAIPAAVRMRMHNSRQRRYRIAG